MKFEEMEQQIREAIESYHKETGRFVLQVETTWFEHEVVGRGMECTLRRLQIISTDRTP